MVRHFGGWPAANAVDVQRAIQLYMYVMFSAHPAVCVHCTQPGEHTRSIHWRTRRVGKVEGVLRGPQTRDTNF